MSFVKVAGDAALLLETGTGAGPADRACTGTAALSGSPAGLAAAIRAADPAVLTTLAGWRSSGRSTVVKSADIPGVIQFA